MPTVADTVWVYVAATATGGDPYTTGFRLEEAVVPGGGFTGPGGDGPPPTLPCQGVEHPR